jgi:methionine biosynthesis protein MetW
MGERTADFYSHHVMGGYEDTPPVIHQRQAKLVRPLPQHGKRTRLLDIGSGAGVGAELLAHTLDVDHVTCIDISTSALGAVIRRGFSPIVASAEGSLLPFPDRTFDVVVLDEVIEHLVDTDSIMSEIHRVLRKDGQLIMSTPNLAAWFNRLALLIGFQPAYSEVSFKGVYGRPGVGIVGHLRLFTRRALLGFVIDKGFRIEAVGGVPFPELPRVLRPIDRLVSRLPGLAGGLVLVARKDASQDRVS